MQFDEMLRAIEQTERENIQDLMQVIICRYRELYPDWRILFVSADTNAKDMRTKELLELIHKANDILSK